MRYRVLDKDKEINVIEAEPDFAAQYAASTGYTLEVLPEPPAPEPPPPEPDLMTDLETLVIDNNLRLTMLELGI